MHACRFAHEGRGPGGPESQEDLDSGEGGFFVGWILGNDRHFLISYYH
ncbi:MAG: hypothetical protein WBN94_09675 [Methanothrix sp.]